MILRVSLLLFKLCTNPDNRRSQKSPLATPLCAEEGDQETELCFLPHINAEGDW